MNPAKYPKELRVRWYLQVEKHHQSVADIARIFGVSRKTYYKWYRIDHGHRPRAWRSAKNQPNLKLTPTIRSLIEQEKQRTNYGPRKMKLLLSRRGISVSTTVIYRFYKRRKLIRRPQKRLPWYEPLKEPLTPHFPGDVVQMDAKYVWERKRRRFQRTFVDVYTGMQYATVTDTLEAADTTAAFEQAAEAFPFLIVGIQSDNGSENRGQFHQYLGQRGIAHYFIPKASPQWDGAVERAHGVIDQEYYLNERRPWKTLSGYLHWYNHERIHLGKYLNGQTPMEKLNQFTKSVTLDC